jgi:AmmeMemoRadiSam system protein B
MVREPAVAGTFYPANAGILRQTVEQLLKASVTSFESGLRRYLCRMPVMNQASGRRPHVAYRRRGTT